MDPILHGQYPSNIEDPMHLKRAVSRVDADNLSRLAKQLGRCGAINEITGYVCVTQPHEDDIEHLSMFIGGPRDGQVTSRWGGTKQNDGTIPTLKSAKPEF